MTKLHNILGYTVVSFLIFLGLSTDNLAHALSNQQAIADARAAYDANKAPELASLVQQLNTKQDILAPYAEYWLMLLNLDEVSNQAVLNFIDRYQDYPFADSMRGAYLKKLGKHQDWSNFSNEFPKYQLKDTGVACYEAEANYLIGNIEALVLAKPLWLQGKDQPTHCTRLFDRMQAVNVLTEDDIRARFRMALAANKVRLAKSIIKRSDSYKAAQIRQITLAYKSPDLVINKRSISFNNQFGREVYLFALSRIARKDTQKALTKFNQIKQHFSREEAAYFYGRLALSAAKDHEPYALSWFEKAQNTVLNHEQMAWYARTALRQKNWTALLTIIAKMPPEQADEARWRYWKARALKTQQQNDVANAILADLSSERHYYGWLAQDDLDGYFPIQQPRYKATKEEINALTDHPAVKRVEALNNADLRWDAKREWLQVIKEFDDKKLIAAAEFAMKKQWFDIGIFTADETRGAHDFSLRYPMPYRELMNPAAKQQGINESWAYGIIRQESRFMHYAKSRVGAAGLMQLMPATAKWAAPRAGLSNYRRSMISELDTNIALGTFYLSYTLEQMGGFEPVASAAYNAGPSRAKKWMADSPLEGAIYAETIPFNETRNYVQRVMANAHQYAAQMGLKKMTLKQRMGIVPGRLTYLSNAN